MSGRSESRILASENHVRLYVRSCWGSERVNRGCVDIKELQGVYVRLEGCRHEGLPVWAGPIDPRLGYSVASPGPCRVYTYADGKNMHYMICDNPGMKQAGGLPGLLKSSEPHGGKPPYSMKAWKVANMKRKEWVPTPQLPLIKVEFKTRLYFSCRHKPHSQGLYDLVDLIDGQPCWAYSTFRLWYDTKETHWALSDFVSGKEKKFIKSEPCDPSKLPYNLKFWKIACAVRKSWVPGEINIEVVDVGTSMGNALRSTTARVDEMKEALSRQMVHNAPKTLDVLCPAIPKYNGKFELAETEKHNHLPIWKLDDKRIYCGTHGHWQFTEHAAGMAHGSAGIRSTEPNMGNLPHQVPRWAVAEHTKPGAPRSWKPMADIAVLPLGTMGSNEEALQQRVKELVTEVKKLRAVGSGVCETYENQRWLPVKGFGTTMLPTDRPIWSRKNGKGGMFKKDMVEPPKDCEWDGDWFIDMEGAGKEGWTFASDFPDHGVHFKFQKKRGPTCCVRRRRWVRKYSPIEDVKADEPEKQAIVKEAPAVEVIDVQEVDEDEDDKLNLTRSIFTAGSVSEMGLQPAKSNVSDDETKEKKVSLMIPMEQSVLVPSDEEKTSDTRSNQDSASQEGSKHSKSTSSESQLGPVAEQRKRAVLRLIETELREMGADDKTTLVRLSRVRQWIEALETPEATTPSDTALGDAPNDKLSPRVAEALQRLKDEVTALKEPDVTVDKRGSMGIAEAAGLLAWEVASSRRALAVSVLSAAIAAACIDNATACVSLPVPRTPVSQFSLQGLTPSVTLLSLSRNSSIPRQVRRTRLHRPPPLLPVSEPQAEVCRRPDEIQLEVPEHWRTPGPTSTPGLTPSITPIGTSATSTPTRTPCRKSWRSSREIIFKPSEELVAACIVLGAAAASWRVATPVKELIRMCLVQQHGSIRGAATYMNGLSIAGNGGEGILQHTLSRAGAGRYMNDVMRGAESALTCDVVAWLECREMSKTASAATAGVMVLLGHIVVGLPQNVFSQPSVVRRYTPRRSPRVSMVGTWNSVPRMRTVPTVDAEQDDVTCLLMLQGECPMLSSERLISALKASVSQRLVTRLSNVVDIKVSRKECRAAASFRVVHGGQQGLEVLLRSSGWLLRGVSGRWTVTDSTACLTSALLPCPLGHITEPLATPSLGTHCDRCRGSPWNIHVSAQAFGCTKCAYVLCSSCLNTPSPVTPSIPLPKRSATMLAELVI